jgi:hypothetical protein
VYIVVGLTRAVAAAMFAGEGYARSVLKRSIWSRLIIDDMPLREDVSFLRRRRTA